MAIVAQFAGRHLETNLSVLALFTTSIPFGYATLIINGFMGSELSEGIEEIEDREKLIAELINLVVPI